MLVVALLLGHPPVAAVACVMCGALVGFLRYNFNPASIFLGDCGALFVGFLLAGLSVHGAQKASTAVAVAIPVLAFGVPVVDTGFTLVRRFLSGRPLFEGDREHIHHMLPPAAGHSAAWPSSYTARARSSDSWRSSSSTTRAGPRG